MICIYRVSDDHMVTNIPKKIHYFWFSGEPLTDLAIKCIDSWRKHCPNYEIVEWNTTNFDVSQCIYAHEAYNAKKWAFLTDYARLFVLYEYGGIYMDADVEVIKNLDPILNSKAGIGFETNEFLGPHFIYSIKRNAYIGYLLSYYKDRHFLLNNGNYDLTTMPISTTKMTHQKYGYKIANSLLVMSDGVTFYPNDYFSPLNHATGRVTITANTYIIHHFNGSWNTKNNKNLYNNIYSLIETNQILCNFQKSSIGRKVVTAVFTLLTALLSYNINYLLRISAYTLKLKLKRLL